MDKQQAARESYRIIAADKFNGFVREHYEDDYPPKNEYRLAQSAFSVGFEAGKQAAQAALMPALVEARDALVRITKGCKAVLISAALDDPPSPINPEVLTEVVKDLSKTLAHLNLVIGDKK